MRAFVLARRDFREYDQVVALYSRDAGKKSALARGVKKMTSKNAAHLEPFSLVDATMERGKEVDHLTKVQPVEYFSAIRSDFAKSRAAGAVVSITDSLTKEGERDVQLFDALHGWLKFVSDDSQQTTDYRLQLDGYIVQLFHCLGFTPILDRCVVCEKIYNEIVKESLTPNYELRTKNSGFYFSGGGMICGECRKKKEMIGQEIFDCGLKEVSDMKLLLKGDWNTIARFDLDESEQKKLHRLVYEFAVYHSEKKIPDWGRVITLSPDHLTT